MKSDIKFNNYVVRNGQGYLEFLNAEREVLYVAKVDKERIPEISEYNWKYYETTNSILGRLKIEDGRTVKNEASLRRLIIGATDSRRVYHKNNDYLDCTFGNLQYKEPKDVKPVMIKKKKDLIDFKVIITNGYVDQDTIEGMTSKGWKFVTTLPAKVVHPHALDTDKATIFSKYTN
jgi:hypothetical protein